MKKSLASLSLGLGVLLSAHLSSSVAYATDTYNNKKTTTVEQTTTQTTSTAPAVRRAAKKEEPVTTTTSSTTTIITKEGDLRKVLDEKALKKMKGSLCVSGFKPYVGNDGKNVCQGKAIVPDIAYSCVWKEEGKAAYAPTLQGPCALDYAEHKGSIIVAKNNYDSHPPLSYGTEAQCCFRAAKGPSTSTTETSPTTTTVAPK